MEKRLECRAVGRVQLVMFRDFVTRKARARGLRGQVMNKTDGSVWFVAEGDESKLKELLELVNRGPILARVDKVDEVWSDSLGEFKSFDIVY